MAILSLSFWLHPAKIKWPRIRLTAHLLVHLIHILLNKYMELLHRQNWLTICFPCLRIAPKQSLSSSASSSYWIHKSVKEDAVIFENTKNERKDAATRRIQNNFFMTKTQSCSTWRAANYVLRVKCVRTCKIHFVHIFAVFLAWNQKFSATTCAPRCRLFSRFKAT